MTLPGQGILGDTYGDGTNNVSIQPGPGGYAGVNSENQQQYFEADDNAIYIGTNYPSSTKNWQFNKDGTTQFPSYKFPYADGTSNQVLITDGAGVLSFANVQSLDTNYNFNATATSGGANLNLVGSDATIDTVKLTNGGHITATYTSGTAVTLGSDATDANTASTIVARDASGNFNASGANLGVITISTGAGGINTTSGALFLDSATGAVNIDNATLTTGSGNVFLFNGVGTTTVDAFEGATSITMGATTGTTTIRNNLITSGDLTVNDAVVFNGLTSGSVTIAAPAVAGSQSYTLPTAVPAVSGYVLSSTTGGTMSWVANPDVNTTYDFNASSTSGGANLNLVGSDATTDTVKLTNGGHITATYTSGTAITLGSDATNVNTASTIVARDASGNFSAGTITAALNGNATTATTAAKVANALTAGTHLSGGPFDGSAAVTLTTDATDANTASTIVARDASGGFSSGSITIANDKVIYASQGTYGPPDSSFTNVRVGLYGNQPSYAVGVESNNSWISGQDGVKLYSAADNVERLWASTAGVKINSAYTLPTADGTANQVIKTDGAGVLSFYSPSDLNTTYTYTASSVAGGANLNLVGSDSTTNTVKLNNAGHITATYVSDTAIDLGSDATSANTASTIVSRDGSGRFSADGATLGNITIGGVDQNLITTSAGDLKLDSFTGNIYVDNPTFTTASGNVFLFNDAATTTADAFKSATTITIGETTGTTTVRNAVVVGGNLTVNGNNVNLAQATIIGYSENNDRTNRLQVQSTTGNSSGLRVLAPNATTSAQSNLGVFSTNDNQNGEFLALRATGSTSAPFSIRTGLFTAGVLSASNKSVRFTDGSDTAYASINPAGPTVGTDLTTKTYVDALTVGVSSVTGGTHVSASPTTGAVVVTTDATDANTASTIVARDASGNFSASGATLGNVTVGVDTDQTISTTSGDLVLQTAAGVNAGNITLFSGANTNIALTPNGTGDVHLNTDSVRIGDNNATATLTTRGTGNLVLTTNEGSAVEGTITIANGANGNITLTPNGTGVVATGVANLADASYVLGGLQATTNTGYTFMTPVLNNVSNNNGLDVASSFTTALGNSGQQQLTQYFGDTFAGTNSSPALAFNSANGNSVTGTTVPWTGVASVAPSQVLTNNALGTLNFNGYATSGFTQYATKPQGGGVNANNAIQIQGVAAEAFADGTLTISGATITAVTRASSALAAVAVTGTRGQISFTATTPGVGHAIVVTGTLTGTATGISAGTYYIIVTNGSTTATLSATPGGSPITTTAGTTTGLTFTRQFITVTYSAQSYIPFGLNALIAVSGFTNVTSGTYMAIGTSTTTSVQIGAVSTGIPALSGSQSLSLNSVSAGGAGIRIRAYPLATPMNSGNRVEIVNHNATAATYRADTFTISSAAYGTTGTARVTVGSTNTTFALPVVFPNYTIAQAGAITGAVGWQIAISNSPTTAGRMAYWSTTATAGWRYVDTNAAI